MSKIICPSCGGTFEDTEPKCPYCGTVYEPGAEKEYKEKLNNIRKDLDVVDEMAEDDYKSELKAFFERFLPLIAVAGFICLVSLISYQLSTTGKVSASRSEIEDEIDELLEFRPYRENFDKLYDAGDYDGMMEAIDSFLDEKGGKFRSKEKLYSWKHYNFYFDYEEYYDAKNDLADYKEALAEGTNSYYEYAEVLNGSFQFYGRMFNYEYDSNITESETEYLKSLCETLEEESLEPLDLTREEYEELRDEALGGESYPSYSVCYDFAEEKVGR